QAIPPAEEPRPDAEFPPGFQIEGSGRDESRTDQPPRRRGGRAAIRSRGGDSERAREASQHADPAAPRAPRSQYSPGGYESDRGRSRAPERYSESERKRTAGPNESGRGRDRDRDRPVPHSRAGEPGYVPRRERLRSGDFGFGADILPPEPDWTERDADL